MPDEAILRVAVPAPLHHPLDYLPPADCPYPVQPGMRVIVPLGARRVVGIVTGVAAHTEVSGGRLKRALDCLDAAPLLSPDILELCDFAARYYYAAPGEALVGTLPLELRTTPRARLRETLCWNASPESQALPPGTLRRAPRQAEALAQLQAAPLGMSDAECQVAGIGRGTLRALAAKGWATAAREPALTVAPGATGPVPCPEPGLALNPDQAHALEALIAAEGFRCSLLEGVTGSGKTEVYLQFIAQVLLRGRQALVLVPEIGLTPLTRRRFTQRFGNQVGVLHSGLTEGARLRTWQDAASGRLRVLIGTRSALFSPLPALGAIIVDEEHDTSFKQQDGFRYSARDLAVFRGRQLDIPVVLGSATPSTESLANCAAGRFHHLSLPHRAGGASPPAMRLLDLRARDLDGGLCQETLDAIGAQLRAGNQVLVFLNRRGWAPLLSCGDCGWMAECRHCDARLTLHRADRLLWCHHCDARVPAPAACPGCRSARLLALGTGTERSEHALQRHFPQVPIRRIDRGTMQGRGAMDELLTQLESGQPCILVGTQMLAKGHHFPAVTLVVIVDIDGGLFSSDLRAAERTGQLLIQVAGRAGRADRPGEVLIQTLHPDHPWLQRLVQGGYRSFIDPLLAERQLHGLPPFAHLALLRAESTREDRAIRLLTNLKRELQPAHPRVNIVGPVPAPLARRAGRFRVQLLMKHPHRAALHAALEHASKLLETRRTTAGERWHIDVDPVEGV